MRRCPECRSFGIIDCTYCRGTTTIKCNICGGTGWLDDDDDYRA